MRCAVPGEGGGVALVALKSGQTGKARTVNEKTANEKTTYTPSTTNRFLLSSLSQDQEDICHGRAPPMVQILICMVETSLLETQIL